AALISWETEERMPFRNGTERSKHFLSNDLRLFLSQPRLANGIAKQSIVPSRTSFPDCHAAVPHSGQRPERNDHD
ncbi:MAG: hypothetical protein KDA89_19720, partial [Planctomycetaceae bacterium]|nr:hypothetical protein [Planctomycetaceae bacterium]